MIYNMHSFWALKLITKLILSKLPFSYNLWSYIGLFRHGAMDDFSYAWKVLQKHASELDQAKGWKGLELGPGDGLLSAFLAPAMGASGLTLVDAGDFAHKDVKRYHQQINGFLKSFPDVRLPKITESNSIDEMLSSVGGDNYCGGLRSLQSLESNSYDLIYSQAVLEHVRHYEFVDTMQECYRLLSPNGVMSHVVDFKDHLGGGLNNLRFSSSLWERNWFASDSGFYTNRIRLSEMISICENIGFEVEVRSMKYWDVVPIQRTQLAKEFLSLSDKDLLISGAHLIMRLKYSSFVD